MSGYRISGLNPSEFSHLYGLDEESLRAGGALRVKADKRPGYPCRITLTDAEPGSDLLLLNYLHQDADTPYRSSHAIFVKEHADSCAIFENEIPEQLAIRLLSVRAFDDDGMMIDADVVEGDALEALIGQFFADLKVRYLHVHNARRGCYAARVDRIAPANI